MGRDTGKTTESRAFGGRLREAAMLSGTAVVTKVRKGGGLAGTAALTVALLVGSASLAASQAWQNDTRSLGREQQPHALALFIHGGGWTHGTSRSGRVIAPFFEGDGFRFESLEYPKPPEVSLVDTVGDLTRQVTAAARHDRLPLTLIGHSAGAQLAAAVAFSPAMDTPVRCLILFDGAGYDLNRFLDTNREVKRSLALAPNAAAQVSPTVLLPRSANRPAVFLAASNERFWGEAQAFSDVARRQGLDVTLERFPAMRHADFVRADLEGSPLGRSVENFLSSHRGCR